MEQLQVAYEQFKAAIFKTWDSGYAEGLDEEFMLADIKDFVANQNDGDRMDATVDMLWEEWKKSK